MLFVYFMILLLKLTFRPGVFTVLHRRDSFPTAEIQQLQFCSSDNEFVFAQTNKQERNRRGDQMRCRKGARSEVW